MNKAQRVASIEALVESVKKDWSKWKTKTLPWFRGEGADYEKEALLPKVYREAPTGERYDENKLLQMFRMKAPSFAGFDVPRREDVDQWLFLARHVGLPTRLLDWTEGLLAAVHFAIGDEKDSGQESNVFVWMLNPTRLNEQSRPEYRSLYRREFPLGPSAFPLTWFSPEKAYTRREDIGHVAWILEGFALGNTTLALNRARSVVASCGGPPNPALLNIRAAWEPRVEGARKLALALPIAVHPTTVHARIGSQKGCFTVHGEDRRGLGFLVNGSVLKKYVLPAKKLRQFRSDLRMMGMTRSTVFPDLDGLAYDLAEICRD